MRIFTFSTIATIIIDISAWFLLHMAFSKWLTSWDVKRFRPQSWIFKNRPWEKGGKIYKNVFRVHLWKKWLPDAAPWFKGGFAKRNFSSPFEDREDYLNKFIVETCRGELAHWITMGCFPLFFLWNTFWVGVFMGIYAVFANLPCILTQRFNRIRLTNLLRVEIESRELSNPS